MWPKKNGGAEVEPHALDFTTSLPPAAESSLLAGAPDSAAAAPSSPALQPSAPAKMADLEAQPLLSSAGNGARNGAGRGYDLEIGHKSEALATVMQQAAELLPHQAILENFVHHNPWETLQNQQVSDAAGARTRATQPCD